ncbi:sulfatase-like hydrolase/transferase, partial [Candidatus Gracilibacteria bacterium]|nr:sulfatase-like hydrolase/transferase [Candidatus Gracilibacteria bacterium]
VLRKIGDYQNEYAENEMAQYVLRSIHQSLAQNKSTESNTPNILLIIADDLGLDAMPGFDEGSLKPYMPNISKLAGEGVTFENLWSAPTCTPTRATILTGKYGYRTNVLQVDDVLSTQETSLQSYLDQETDNTYSHAVIGKWHLSKDVNHPTQMGVGYYAGMLTGSAKSYTDWRFTQNGQTTRNTEYITTKFTDLAIDWIGNQQKPWFLWLAYTAPHTPFHLPPSELHSQGNISNDPAAIEQNPLVYYMAALEALDTELGRLFESIPQEELENTTIIFIGDNGTPNQVAQFPYTRQTVKGTLYQGGIHVPMIASGYGVTRMGEREERLVNTTDIFSTILDIANTGVSEINDSKSFKNSFSQSNILGRDFVYAEVGSGRTAGHTIRNDQYKLIVLDNGKEELYDLIADPYENNKLGDAALTNIQSLAKQELKKQITQIQK